MIPGGLIAALDWLYSTRRSWQRIPKGSRRRQGYLAVAARLCEMGGATELRAFAKNFIREPQ